MLFLYYTNNNNCQLQHDQDERSLLLSLFKSYRNGFCFFTLVADDSFLLLGYEVQCDEVGHGKHELKEGKIVKLVGNTKIAENPEDLGPYKKKEGACEVEMDNNRNI